MEENTKIWDKKMDELTVKDTLLISATMPIVAIGIMVVAGAVVGGTSSLVGKFRTRKTDLTETTTN